MCVIEDFLDPGRSRSRVDVLIYYCTPILTEESNKVSNAIMTKMFEDVRVARRTSLMTWGLGCNGRQAAAVVAEG